MSYEDFSSISDKAMLSKQTLKTSLIYRYLPTFPIVQLFGNSEFSIK